MAFKFEPPRDRRFPKPWRVEEQDQRYAETRCGQFVIKDASGFKIAFVNYDDGSQERADVAGTMNRRQALQIANRIARIGAE